MDWWTSADRGTPRAAVSVVDLVVVVDDGFLDLPHVVDLMLVVDVF